SEETTQAQQYHQVIRDRRSLCYCRTQLHSPLRSSSTSSFTGPLEIPPFGLVPVLCDRLLPVLLFWDTGETENVDGASSEDAPFMNKRWITIHGLLPSFFCTYFGDTEQVTNCKAPEM
ncbi:hypothetical protein ANANG_G00238760, partial [Anguilla anguilla]